MNIPINEPREPDQLSGKIAAQWRSDAIRVGLLMLAVLAIRWPTIMNQLPAQDEDYFAVPGWTILQEGIPRIPYMPSRNPAGAFYRADEILFTLPPGYFYWQAGWYAVCGASTGIARLASLAAGLIALAVLFCLGCRLTGSRRAAWWGTVLYALSRPFMFPCIISRPDMLCGLCGLAALLALESWTRHRTVGRLVLCGVLLGAGFLTHPFALIFALQCGVWLVLCKGTLIQRFLRGCLLVAITMAVFSLWLLLILQTPEVFQKQFFNNVLGQAGPGLVSRFVWPWDSFRAQTPIFWELTGLPQGLLMIVGVMGVTVGAFWRIYYASSLAPTSSTPRWPDLRLAALTLSAIYLMVVCQGEHPTKGYWCYTAAPVFLCVGVCLDRMGLWISQEGLWEGATRSRINLWWARGGQASLFLFAAALMIPGSGLRTSWEYLKHRHEMNYNAPRFTAELMAHVPAEARLVVDPGYIFDFYRAGRNVTLALTYEFFFDVRGTPYDYVIGGPYSIRDGVPDALSAELIGEYGEANNPFTCLAKIYQAPISP